jgi:hypothetical protein
MKISGKHEEIAAHGSGFGARFAAWRHNGEIADPELGQRFSAH